MHVFIFIGDEVLFTEDHFVNYSAITYLGCLNNVWVNFCKKSYQFEWDPWNLEFDMILEIIQSSFSLFFFNFLLILVYNRIKYNKIEQKLSHLSHKTNKRKRGQEKVQESETHLFTQESHKDTNLEVIIYS